jgi:hypothetical protein
LRHLNAEPCLAGICLRDLPRPSGSPPSSKPPPPCPAISGSLDFGLPGVLWGEAQGIAVLRFRLSLSPASRSGPAPAHDPLLADDHRIYHPGRKRGVDDRCSRTILASKCGFPAERSTSQAFWEFFERIRADGGKDAVDRAQARTLGARKDRHLEGRSLSACDSTNFHTRMASTGSRN